MAYVSRSRPQAQTQTTSAAGRPAAHSPASRQQPKQKSHPSDDHVLGRRGQRRASRVHRGAGDRQSVDDRDQVRYRRDSQAADVRRTGIARARPLLCDATASIHSHAPTRSTHRESAAALAFHQYARRPRPRWERRCLPRPADGRGRLLTPLGLPITRGTFPHTGPGEGVAQRRTFSLTSSHSVRHSRSPLASVILNSRSLCPSRRARRRGVNKVNRQASLVPLESAVPPERVNGKRQVLRSGLTVATQDDLQVAARRPVRPDPARYALPPRKERPGRPQQLVLVAQHKPHGRRSERGTRPPLR